MEEMIYEFDLENYLHNFKKKKKFQISNISDVHKILDSFEYSQFINDVYKYYNDLAQSSEIRLELQFYNQAGIIIDNFWKLLLGDDLNNKFNRLLKTKLKL